MSERRSRMFSWARTTLGYALFVAAIIYAVSHAPAQAWQVELRWVAVTALVMPAMIALQMAQVRLFLRAHNVRHGWYWPLLFTLKKGVFNAILPARTGTLVLMYLLTRHYPVKWHQYLHFGLVAAIAALIVSGLAAMWLFLSVHTSAIAALAVVGIAWVLERRFPESYYGQALSLLLIAIGLFATMIVGFWSLLHGLGFGIGFWKATYLATVLNILSQASLTPGNMGIREVVMGALAPQLALPISVAILTGSVFHIIRTIIYAIGMIGVEWLPRLYPGQLERVGTELTQRMKR